MVSKTFRMGHLDFTNLTPETIFDEESAPAWLVSKAYKWFYDAYVLTLPVGGRVETDFRYIVRET